MGQASDGGIIPSWWSKSSKGCLWKKMRKTESVLITNSGQKDTIF